MRRHIWGYKGLALNGRREMKKRGVMLEELLGLKTIYIWKADTKKGEEWRMKIFISLCKENFT